MKNEQNCNIFIFDEKQNSQFWMKSGQLIVIELHQKGRRVPKVGDMRCYNGTTMSVKSGVCLCSTKWYKMYKMVVQYKISADIKSTLTFQ